MDDEVSLSWQELRALDLGALTGGVVRSAGRPSSNRSDSPKAYWTLPEFTILYEYLYYTTSKEGIAHAEAEQADTSRFKRETLGAERCDILR